MRVAVATEVGYRQSCIVRNCCYHQGSALPQVTTNLSPKGLRQTQEARICCTYRS